MLNVALGLFLARHHARGRVAGGTHGGMPVQFHLLAGEEQVDLFQGQVARLRVEEVDQWEEAEVEDGKVDVGAVADVVDAHRGDFHDEEGEDPCQSLEECHLLAGWKAYSLSR